MAVINVKCVYAHALFRIGCPVPVDSELERGTLAGLLFQNGLNEYLNIHWLLSLEDAQDKLDKWRRKYPH
ncbi:hypothetical protein DK562_20350 [Salmonella enterica]|nr:hypothetical protein [Salmonella enterica]ECI4209149.1 hypothetical protein [Salmonella enterica subsp. enterica]EDE2666266.1 hypothetical protein [Salmonella enterica subsp. enterica]